MGEGRPGFALFSAIFHKGGAMKRLLFFGLMFILLLLRPFPQCYAVQEPVDIDVTVEIKHGGTAVLTAQEGSPMPDRSRLAVPAGKTDAFHFSFSAVGCYSYTVKNQPDGSARQFDDRVYNLNIYVTEEEGRLCTSVVVYLDKGGKYDSGSDCRLVFTNSALSGVEQPNTGDDNRLNRYLSAAILASAGLFCQSVLYLTDIVRQRKRRQ